MFQSSFSTNKFSLADILSVAILENKEICTN